MATQKFHNLSDEKKEKIIKAATDEFLSKSYVKASVDSIIVKAEITKGSFYRYFEDKKDIFFYVLSRNTYKYLSEIKKGNYDILDYEIVVKNEKDMIRRIGEVNYRLIIRLLEAPLYIVREWIFNCVLPMNMQYYKEGFDKIKDRLPKNYDTEFLAFIYTTAGMVTGEYVNYNGLTSLEGIKHNNHVYQVILKGIQSLK